MLLSPPSYIPQPTDVLGYFAVGPGGTKTVSSVNLGNGAVTFTDGSTAPASTLALVSCTATASVEQLATVAAGGGNTGSGVVTSAMLNPQQWLQNGAQSTYTVAFLAPVLADEFVPPGAFLAGSPVAGVFPVFANQLAAMFAAGALLPAAQNPEALIPGPPIAWTVTNAAGAQIAQGLYGTFEVVSSAAQYASAIAYPNAAMNFQVSNDTLSYTPPTSTVINIFGLQLTVTGSPESGDTFTVTPG